MMLFQKVFCERNFSSQFRKIQFEHFYSAVIVRLVRNVSHLHSSKADNSYAKKAKEYLEPHLLILDELGFKKIPDYSADIFSTLFLKDMRRGQ